MPLRSPATGPELIHEIARHSGVGTGSSYEGMVQDLGTPGSKSRRVPETEKKAALEPHWNPRIRNGKLPVYRGKVLSTDLPIKEERFPENFRDQCPDENSSKFAGLLGISDDEARSIVRLVWDHATEQHFFEDLMMLREFLWSPEFADRIAIQLVVEMQKQPKMAWAMGLKPFVSLDFNKVLEGPVWAHELGEASKGEGRIYKACCQAILHECFKYELREIEHYDIDELQRLILGTAVDRCAERLLAGRDRIKDLDAQVEQCFIDLGEKIGTEHLEAVVTDIYQGGRGAALESQPED